MVKDQQQDKEDEIDEEVDVPTMLLEEPPPTQVVAAGATNTFTNNSTTTGGTRICSQQSTPLDMSTPDLVHEPSLSMLQTINSNKNDAENSEEMRQTMLTQVEKDAAIKRRYGGGAKAALSAGPGLASRSRPTTVPTPGAYPSQANNAIPGAYPVVQQGTQQNLKGVQQRVHGDGNNSSAPLDSLQQETRLVSEPSQVVRGNTGNNLESSEEMRAHSPIRNHHNLKKKIGLASKLGPSHGIPGAHSAVGGSYEVPQKRAVRTYEPQRAASMGSPTNLCPAIVTRSRSEAATEVVQDQKEDGLPGAHPVSSAMIPIKPSKKHPTTKRGITPPPTQQTTITTMGETSQDTNGEGLGSNRIAMQSSSMDRLPTYQSETTNHLVNIPGAQFSMSTTATENNDRFQAKEQKLEQQQRYSTNSTGQPTSNHPGNLMVGSPKDSKISLEGAMGGRNSSLVPGEDESITLPPLPPTTTPASTSNNDIGGGGGTVEEHLIQAELVQERSEPNILTVSAVEVDPNEEANQDKKPIYQHKQFAKFALFGGCICLIIIIVVAVVASLVAGGGGGGSESNNNNNNTNSGAPTAPPTGISPNLEDIQSTILPLLEDPSQLDDPTSPYSEALHWLVYIDKADPGSETLKRRYLLAAFYFLASADHNWEACSFTTSDDISCEHPEWDKGSKEFDSVPASRWLSRADECTWAGVSCDKQGIKRIQLLKYKLNGKLLPEIGKIKELSVLELSSNPDLTGPIPTSLGDLPRLHKLFIKRCGLTGALPHEICSAARMKEMSFSENGLTGTIPTCLWQLTRFEKLELDNNGLTGRVPSEIGLLTNLEAVELDNNNLHGSVPDELCELSRASLLSDTEALKLKVDCGDDDIDDQNYVACDPSCNCEC